MCVPYFSSSNQHGGRPAVKRTLQLELDLYGHPYITLCVILDTSFQLSEPPILLDFLGFELMHTKEICKPKFYTSVMYYNTLLSSFNLPR